MPRSGDEVSASARLPGLVFLSYARTDRATAGQVADALGTAGVDVWWDEKLKTAESWQDALHDKASRSDTVRFVTQICA